MSLIHIEDKYFEYPELVEKLRNEFFNMVATLDPIAQRSVWETFQTGLEQEYQKLKKKKPPKKSKKATATIQFYFPNAAAQEEAITIDETKLGQMRHPERFTASIDKLKSLEGKMIELDSSDFETLSTLLTREKATGILNIIENIRSKLRFIRITNVHEIANRGSARSLAEIPLGFGKMLSNRHIQTKMTVSDTDGVLRFHQNQDAETESRDCLIRALLNTFKESYDNCHKKKKLTHASFLTYLKNCTASVAEIEPFLRDNRLCLTAYNRNNELVYQYDPETEGKSRNSRISPAHCYLAIHNKHAYLLDKDIPSLSHKKPSVQTPSENYPNVSVDPENCVLINDISGLVGFFQKTQTETGKSYKIHYNNNLEELFFHMCDVYKYEADIYINREVITGLTFHLQNTYRLSDFPIEVGDEGRLRIEPTEYKSFIDWLQRFTNKFFQNDSYKSHYSKSLKTAWTELSKAQLFRRFNSDNDGYSETIDVIRAYTKNLCDIKYIPVFNALDDFRQYNEKDPINPNAFYIIENTSNTLESWFIGNKRVSMVSGFVLAESGVKHSFKILSYIEPSHLEPNPFPALIEQLYSDNSLRDSTKKFIVNMVIGLMNKRYVQCERALYTTDIDEANIFSETVSAIREKEYLSIQSSDRIPLANGFMPIGFLVYDLMRLRMLNVYRDLKAADIKVYGIATDCFFVDKSTGVDVCTTKTFADLGKLHTDGLKLIPKKLWSIEENENPIQLPRRQFSRTQFLNPGTIVSGFLPGCGKTHLLATTLPIGKTVFLTSTNEQEERLQKTYGHTAMTLCKFLGLRVQEDGTLISSNLSKTYSFEHIVIDEVYQQNLVLVSKFRIFQWNHPDLNYYASGDPYQTNAPIPWNNVKLESKYFDILADMFPMELRMKGCKRFQNKGDIETLEKIWTDLFKNHLSPGAVIEAYKLNQVKDLSQLKEFGIERCLTLRNSTAQMLNKQYVDWGYSRQTVIPKQYCKPLIVNRKYSVESVEGNCYKINGKLYQKSIFRFPYASTTHSSQGSTISEKYAIFDINSKGVTKEWLWVAITRATSLSQIYVYIGSEFIPDICGELAVALKKQNYCCSCCGEILDLTIDSGLKHRLPCHQLQS